MYDIVEIIVPHDGTRFSYPYEAILVEEEGTVKIQPVYGTPIMFTIAVAPFTIPVRTVKVFDTGTTSTLIKGLRYKQYISPHEAGRS